MRSKTLSVVATCLALCTLCQATDPEGSRPDATERFAAATAVGYPQYPSLSPNGSLVAFSWAGDIWSVPSSGGAASRLTAHPGTERRSAFSPDGTLLAFESNRDGARNIYVSELLGSNGSTIAGPAQRLTWSDRSLTLSGFSADGSELYFSGRLEPSLYRHERMYRVSVAGGPIERITDAFGSLPRQGGAPAAAGGNSVVFARGYSSIWDRPTYRGTGSQDVYALNTERGTFKRLTFDEANDGDAFGLSDGSVLFISSRDGQNNLFRLRNGKTDNHAGALSQLTSFGPDEGSVTIGHGVRDLAVSADGTAAAFVAWDTLYTLDLRTEGSDPQPVVIAATADTDLSPTERIDLSREVTETAMSPDGKTIAVVARGEIFVRSTEEDRPTRRVTHTYGRERNIAWAPDGSVLYYATDDNGDYAICKASVALTREDILPPADEEAESEEEDAEQADEDPEESSEPDDAETAPDDAEGDKDSPEAPDDGETGEDEPEEDEEPKVDLGKRWADALRFETATLIDSTERDRLPLPSPDGRKLIYVRSRGDIILVDLANGNERTLVESWDEPEVIWTGDSRHIIYSLSDLDFNNDIWLLDTGAEPGTTEAAAVNLTQHPDNDHEPRLSADGKVLVFLSERAGENWSWDVWGVFLDKSLESLTDYELAEHFKKAAEKAKKSKPLDPVDLFAEYEPAEPLEFDADDAWLRVRRLTSLDSSANELAISASGARVAFSAAIDGTTSYHSVDYKGSDRKTVTSGRVSGVSRTLKGDKLVFVKSGQASSAGFEGGKVTTYGINANVVIDIALQQRQKFLEATRTLGERFYHPTLKGLDWEGLTDRYLSLAMKTRTADGFNRVLRHMFGELDGSHTGASGGGRFSPPAARVGYLGVETEPVAGGYRITHVVEGSPAAGLKHPLKSGDLLVEIDGLQLAREGRLPHTDLRKALADTTGVETLLRLNRASEEDPEYVLVEPISFGALNDLAYNDKVLWRRARVEELSGGRLGYLHIRGMSMAYVRTFERDLYAAAHGKDGLIIDVRDNGGGSTTDILLASLTAPVHAYTIPRGADPETVPRDAYPRDRRLIYGYGKPINVLMNQNSFSNAEIFSHSIKTTGRGKLVGTRTFGGVISTGGIRLIDGTFIRIPFRGWYLPDGTDMENHGAIPDIDVPQTPEDEAAGRDRQLEAAAKELLERLDTK